MELRKSFKQPQERAAYLRHVRPWVEEDKGTQVDLALADALIAGRHDRVSIMVSFPAPLLLRNQHLCLPLLPAEKYSAAQNVLQNCAPQNPVEMSTFRELSVKTLLGRCVPSVSSRRKSHYCGRQFAPQHPNLASPPQSCITAEQRPIPWTKWQPPPPKPSSRELPAEQGSICLHHDPTCHQPHASSFASLLTSKPRDVVHSIFNELTAK